MKFTFPPEAIATDDKGNIYYSVHSQIMKIGAQGDVIGKVVTVDQAEAGRHMFDILDTPRSMIFLGGKSMALIAGNAIFKLTFP